MSLANSFLLLSDGLFFGDILVANSTVDPKKDKQQDDLYFTKYFRPVATLAGCFIISSFSWRRYNVNLEQASFMPSGQDWLGFCFVLLGLGLRFWARYTLGKYFTYDVCIREGHKLITTGPYTWLRHPGYAGSLTMLIGIGILHDAIGLWVFVACYYGGFTYTRILNEERVLKSAFGPVWDAYAASRYRLLPLVV